MDKLDQGVLSNTKIAISTKVSGGDKFYPRMISQGQKKKIETL